MLWRLEAMVTQTRVFIRPSPKRPEKTPLASVDRQIVDACETFAHQARGVKFPVFVAEGSIPVPAIIMPLIGKPDGDPVGVKSP